MKHRRNSHRTGTGDTAEMAATSSVANLKSAFLALSPSDRATFLAFANAVPTSAAATSAIKTETAAAALPPPTVPQAPSSPGALLAELPEVSFLAPRGKFRVRFCENATVLVGKSTEVVVPHASVKDIFTLPEASGGPGTSTGELIVLSLSPAAVNGKASVSAVVLHSKPADPALAVPASGGVLPAQLSDKTTSVLCLAGS